MRANIVDLRYRMKDILKALNRNESVVILYHGKEKAIITPILKKKTGSVKEHPLFGALKNETQSVEEIMNELRGDRDSDI